MKINRYDLSLDSRRRDGKTATDYQLFQVAQAGVDMLYAAIGTADTEDNAEFFVRAYEQWGPLVTTALEEMSLGYRSTRTGERMPR